MESELSSSSSSGRSRSRRRGGSSSHRRRRSRRRRHKHRNQHVLLAGIVRGLGKFYLRNKRWLLGILAAAVLLAILFFGFRELEREAVNEAAGGRSF